MNDFKIDKDVIRDICKKYNLKTIGGINILFGDTPKEDAIVLIVRIFKENFLRYLNSCEKKEYI